MVMSSRATGRSNGVLVGVLQGTPRPFREAGADPLTPLPAGSPCCVPRFDGNPERLRVDTDGLAGAVPLDVASGTMLWDVLGPLDYGYRTYTLLPESRPVATGSPAARAVPVPPADVLTVGSLNLQRFFDAEDDGEGTTLTPTAFSARLAKASLAIRNLLRTPDVLALVEVEDADTLRALAARLSADALADGAPDPAYQAFLEGGNDPGGIDVGFLVASRVAVLSVVQEGKGATYTDPTTGSSATLNDRPPLVLTARWAAPGGTDLVVTVVANHLRSLNDSELDSTTGRRVRAKRQAQAEYLAALLARLQAEGGGAPLLAVGDFNAFELSDGLADVIGTARGTPAPADQVVVNRSVDLVDPDLVDLCAVDALVPPSERYSYVYDGNAQLLDHALASAATLPLVRGVAFARLGADFPETMRGDAARPERLSDHDALVVRIGLAPQEGRSPVVPVPDREPPSPFRSRAPETIP